jgi:MAF protein
MPSLLLASASPRRRELLALSGLEFRVSAAATSEVPQPNETPEQLVRRLSQAKARAVAAEAPHRPAESAVVLGADTIVVLDGDIIGKPRNTDHALELLHRLRGRRHRVLTGVTVIDAQSGAETSEFVEAEVPMRDYAEAELEAYVATGDPLDKAGAYAIQHPHFQPVDLPRFEDCVANVMGLPVCSTLRLLASHRVESTLKPGDCHAYDRSTCPIAHRLFVNGLNG